MMFTFVNLLKSLIARYAINALHVATRSCRCFCCFVIQQSAMLCTYIYNCFMNNTNTNSKARRDLLFKVQMRSFFLEMTKTSNRD